MGFFFSPKQKGILRSTVKKMSHLMRCLVRWEDIVHKINNQKTVKDVAYIFQGKKKKRQHIIEI